MKVEDLQILTYLIDPTENVLIEWRDEGRWAVTSVWGVLSHEGKWEYEPFPSSRGEEFKARTRYPSPQAALDHWEKVRGAE